MYVYNNYFNAISVSDNGLLDIFFFVYRCLKPYFLKLKNTLLKPGILNWVTLLTQRQ